MRAAEPFQFDIAAVVEGDVLIADGVTDHLADENLAAVGLRGHPRRHRDIPAEQVVAAAHRLAHVDAYPDTDAVGPPAK